MVSTMYKIRRIFMAEDIRKNEVVKYSIKRNIRRQDDADDYSRMTTQREFDGKISREEGLGMRMTTQRKVRQQDNLSGCTQDGKANVRVRRAGKAMTR